MEGQQIGASVEEGVRILPRVTDHQVHVQRLARTLLNGVHNERAKRQVGHKVSIHDIEVQPVTASLLHGVHFVTQLGEVCGKQRRGDSHGMHAVQYA